MKDICLKDDSTPCPCHSFILFLSLLPETRLFFPLFLFPMFLFLAADTSVSHPKVASTFFLILSLSLSLCFRPEKLGSDPSQPETFPLLCTQRIQGPGKKLEEKEGKKSSSADLNASFSRRRQRRRQSSFLLSLKRTTSILLWFLLRQSCFLLMIFDVIKDLKGKPSGQETGRKTCY